MRFGKLKPQLKADQVERIAEISVKGDSNNNDNRSNNNNNNIVACIKQGSCLTKSQGKPSEAGAGPAARKQTENQLRKEPKSRNLKA